MYDYHTILGASAVVLVFIGYWFYLGSVFRGQTKPHPFTWLLFLVLDVTIFIAQVKNNGGLGAWAMGVGTLFATVVFLFALRQGWKDIKTLDWLCLALALIAIAAWNVTGNALYAVALAALADAIAKVPTIRKSYIRPDEESLSIWSFDMLRFSLSIAALSSIGWITALFPAEIVVTNAVVVATILIRRRQLRI
ncbi:hypothetical protein EXS56_01810 [Candidatus Kaiserbacteria bacterium]|nr:hypothetical protein [Candidatus Kaiserbacteria bacterium]